MGQNDTILQFAIENGLIDLHSIWQEYELKEREKYLSQHRFKCWVNKKGQHCTYLPDELADRGRRICRRNTKALLEKEIIRFYKDAEENPTLKEVFYMWVNRKLEYEEIFKQTYDRYENDFKRFFGESKLKNRKMSLITERELEEFIRDTIHERSLSAKGWANLRLIINGMFKYGKKMGYTEISITLFMGDLDISKKAYRRVIKDDTQCVFTEEEQERILCNVFSNPPSLLDYGIVLAFLTGLRVGEISALQKEDINGNILSVSKTEIRYKNEKGKNVYEVRPFTKGEKGFRNVILTDLAVDLIKAIISLNPNGQYLFEEAGGRIIGIYFTKRLEKICKRISIPPRSIHKARKTYATQLLNANISERLILNQMGHVDISTTKGFYFFNNISMEKARSQVDSALCHLNHFDDLITESHTIEIAESQ